MLWKRFHLRGMMHFGHIELMITLTLVLPLHVMDLTIANEFFHFLNF